jgi:Patatin-like phospholipase
MTERFAAAPHQTSEPYSPQLRTALVLTGTGTAGAYHAGALRALAEAGVKIDLVAGRGIGAVGAMFHAIDGASRLWDEKGFWRTAAIAGLYRWRRVPNVMAVALAVAAAVIAIPIAAVALGLIVFPIDFLLKVVGLSGASGLVGWYTDLAESAFAPSMLPTWLPRIVLLVLGTAVGFALFDGWRQHARQPRGPFWWRLLRPPLSAREAVEHTWRVLWDLLRGAAQLSQPGPGELARRYVEVVADNLGQPGFRELLITVHDIDAHRDLLFALVAEQRRRDLVRRPRSEAAETRRAEVFDLAGADRELLADAIAAAVTIPLATEPHSVTFSAESYWRGETHRLVDRPASLIRLIDELIELGVKQIVLVAGTEDASGPHTLAPPRLDGRGRLGEYVASAETAIVRDATTTTGGVRIYTIRPVHNPIGPFDFSGGFDDRSHRAQPLAELMGHGYEDAYHQFIEPVVGASGERITHR